MTKFLKKCFRIIGITKGKKFKQLLSLKFSCRLVLLTVRKQGATGLHRRRNSRSKRNCSSSAANSSSESLSFKFLELRRGERRIERGKVVPGLDGFKTTQPKLNSFETSKTGKQKKADLARLEIVQN